MHLIGYFLFYLGTCTGTSEVAKQNEIYEMTERIFGAPFAHDEVTIVLPSTYEIDSPLSLADRQSWIQGMRTMLSELAGGCTLVNGVGSYVTSSNSLVEESVTLLVVSINLNDSILFELRS